MQIKDQSEVTRVKFFCNKIYHILVYSNSMVVVDKFSGLIKRQIKDLRNIIQVIPDEKLSNRPSDDIRYVGEIILHLIRSFEFYLQGMVGEKWEPLAYTFDEYGTQTALLNLLDSVTESIDWYLTQITSEHLHREYTQFNREAIGLELLIEIIDHSSHHIGQLTVYLRMMGIEPPKIEYIV